MESDLLRIRVCGDCQTWNVATNTRCSRCFADVSGVIPRPARALLDEEQAGNPRGPQGEGE